MSLGGPEKTSTAGKGHKARKTGWGQLMEQACTEHITDMISCHFLNNTVRGEKSHPYFTGEETKPVEAAFLAQSHSVFRSQGIVL